MKRICQSTLQAQAQLRADCRELMGACCGLYPATRVLAFRDPMQLSPIDNNYPNEELRWFTPSYGPAAIALTGILFRFAD